MRRKELLGIAALLLILFSGLIYFWNKKPQNNNNFQSLPSRAETAKKEVTENKPVIPLEDITFPKNFFFGTASSDFQTTGGTGQTDWDLYIDNCIKTKGCRGSMLNNGTDQSFVGPGTGNDFLTRYNEDISLAAGKTQVHRLSLEWSRIEPKKNVWDQSAIDKYKEIFLFMRSEGIEPMICLNHFALPLWVVEKGGMESPEFKLDYSKYAEVVAEKIGKPLKIKWWLTFNEPQVILGQSYVKGTWPPYRGIKSLQDNEGYERLALAMNNLMEAHRRSYRAIHRVMDKETKVMVSFASAPGAFYPNDPKSPLDQLAVNAYSFIGAIMFDFSIGTSDRDFIGINYYGRNFLKLDISLSHRIFPWLDEEKPFAVEWISNQQNRLKNRPKEFYPKGLYDLIMKFSKLGLPIIITENGINDPEDKFREEFIIIHLKAIHDAIAQGANVIGYQYWALTDTWEWDGFFSQMGLISIDRSNDLERKLRPSADTYAEIIRTHRISKELLEKHKELLP